MTIQEQLMELKRQADFGMALWAKVLETHCEGGCDEFCDDFMEVAEEFGVAKRVEYDPENHIIDNSDYYEKGDEIWVWDKKGEKLTCG